MVKTTQHTHPETKKHGQRKGLRQTVPEEGIIIDQRVDKRRLWLHKVKHPGNTQPLTLQNTANPTLIPAAY